MQIRSVKCVDVWHEDVLPAEHCGNLRRPPRTKPCSCSEMPCHGLRALCPASQAFLFAARPCFCQDEEWFDAQTPYVELGCFQLLKPYKKHKGLGEAVCLAGCGYLERLTVDVRSCRRRLRPKLPSCERTACFDLEIR